MTKYLLLVLLLIAIGCAACAQPLVQPLAQPLPKPDHVVIVIEENKNYEDIIDSDNAKYINCLAKNGASLNFYAFHHPSQPNYFEFFAGTNAITYTVNGTPESSRVLDDSCVKHMATNQSLGGLLGKDFGGYGEGWDPASPTLTPPELPIPCTVQPPGTVEPPVAFARKHDPWMMFSDSIAATRSITEFRNITAHQQFGQLPKVSLVIPNLIHDMHSEEDKGSGEGKDIPTLVKNGDTWLWDNLDGYARWAMKNNSLLIVTWDENSRGKQEGHDNGTPFAPPKNHIATILIGPMVKPGSSSSVEYNHHDLLRTIEDMYGLHPYLGGSATARDITDIWQQSTVRDLNCPRPAY